VFESKKTKAVRAQLRSEQGFHDEVLAYYREQLYAEQERIELLENEISQLRARIYRLEGVK
jgi:hypothetical protein